MVLFRSFDHLGFTSVMMDVLVYSLIVMILNALFVVAQKLVIFYVYHDTDFLKQIGTACQVEILVHYK